MSKRLDANITCPRCSHEFPMQLYRSIWAEDSENRALIMSDEINAMTCPQCKLHQRLEFPFLCTNVKRGFALWYEPYPDPQIDKDADDYRKHMGADSFYAKAPRIQDWDDFKKKLLEMEASTSSETRPVSLSPEMQKNMAGFVSYIEERNKHKNLSQDAAPIPPMTPARLAFYSTVVVGFMLFLGVMVFSLGLGAFLYPSIPAESITAMSLIPALICACFFYSWFLRKRATQYRICASTQQGKIKKLSSGIMAGFLFGALWRSCITGLATNAGVDFLKSAYSPDRPVFMIDIAGSSICLFLAFWWLYVFPMGKHRILFGATDSQLAQPENTIDASDSENYRGLKDSMGSLKEAIVGTLGTIAAISYYGIGLIGFAAIVSFFHNHWGWWLIPSVIVSFIVAEFPVVGAAAGIYAAVTIWGWSLYAAIALFCFPLLIFLVIMAVAGVSVATSALFGRKA